MASAMAEVVEDYESDPEEAKRSLTMRRREASDDEEEETEGESGPPPRRIESRPGIESDGGESDGGGAPAEYDDEEDEDEEEEEEEIEEEEELEEYEVVVEKEEYERSGGKEGGVGVGDREVEGEERDVGESTVEVNDQGDGEEKKENEPFAVPTAGAFYMHDDRFRDNAGGRNRYCHWHQFCA